MQPADNQQKNPFSSFGVRSFVSFCRPARARLLLVAFVFIIANLLLSVQPVFLGKLVDSLGATPIDASRAWWFAGVLIALSSGHDVLWRLAEVLYRNLLFKLSFDYETFMFKRVISMPYPYFVDKFTGKIGSYITTCSSELKGMLDNVMFEYINSVISIVVVLVIMANINWQTSAIIAACLLLMLVSGRFTLGKDMLAQKVEADLNSTKNGHIIDAIANFVSVKSFHKERVEYAAVNAQQQKTYLAAKRSFFWGIVYWATQSLFVRHVMWPGIVLLNLWFVLTGKITVGQFTTVLSAALLFTQTIWQIVWNVSQLGQRVSKIEEAHTYLFGEVNIAKNLPNALTVRSKKQLLDTSLTIKNVTFAYPDKPDINVLEGVSLAIKAGEKVGIVGKSGSGKTTLTKLLLGQYDTPDDTFLLDDTAVPANAVSQLIAYVPQDTTLFHRSISDNIAYGANGTPGSERIKTVAVHAQADEFIRKLPQGYDTLVGERGIKLSGGQRQRIAIARAILKDSPILVLDEATSALDSESELHVQKALENLWQGKTVIAIAHRLSTLRHMDRIVVMDEGKIIEQGTHAKLLKLGKTYATLWKHQSGGFIKE